MLSSLLILFLKSCFIGFVLAVPVGPVGILCVRRTLGGHAVAALMIGVGAALADAVYSAIAGFSLAGIGALIQQYSSYIHLFGGLFVGWLGIKIVRAPLRQNASVSLEQDSALHGLISAFLLTLSNPITLIVFAAAFTMLNVVLADNSLSQGLALTGGVFLGAMGWWTSLTVGVHLLRYRLSEKHLLWLSRFSGILLLGFSGYILLDLCLSLIAI